MKERILNWSAKWIDNGKSRLVPVLKKLNFYFEKGEGDKVRMFRIITFLVWINFFGIFVLSKANYWNIMNPFRFLFPQPIDTRSEITLFFPGSIDELHEKSDSMEITRLVELRQKTEYNDDYKSPGRENRIQNNARMILSQLASPPDSIRGVRAIKDETLVKTIWYTDGKLIVHLDKKKIEAMDENQQTITLGCIQKSLQANLGAFTEIRVVVQ